MVLDRRVTAGFRRRNSKTRSKKLMLHWCWKFQSYSRRRSLSSRTRDEESSRALLSEDLCCLMSSNLLSFLNAPSAMEVSWVGFTSCCRQGYEQIQRNYLIVQQLQPISL